MTTYIKNIYIKLIAWIGGSFPSVGIPVLLYHSISDDSSKMSVSAVNFEKQLISLRAHGYSSISLADLNSCFDKNNFPQKKVLITFDDGFVDNLEVAVPLLKKYGFGAVFFIAGKYIGLTADFCSNDIDRVKKMMSDDQLLDLHNSGMEIANHFFSHQILSEMNDDEIKNDYQKNLDKLSTVSQNSESIKYVAYPKNKKKNISSLLRSLGVVLGFGGRSDVVKSGCDKYDLPRIQVYNSDSVEKFKAKLSGYYYVLPKLICYIKFILRSPWFYALLALVLSRFVFFQLGLAGWPADAALVGDWWTAYGGDEVYYFKSAQSLMAGDVFPKSHPIGFPLFFIPFIWLASPAVFIDIFPLMSFINGVVLYGLSLVLVYFLAKEVLASKLKAYIVTIVFNIYPYLFYFLFKIGVSNNDIIGPFINSRFRQLMFWHVGSDPLSTVLIVASLLILVLIIKNKINSVGFIALLGIIASWAAVTRMQNLIILPIFFFTLLAIRKIKFLIYFTVFGAPLILFQAYINFISRGSVLATTYKVNLGSGGDIPIFDLAYISRIITYPLDYGAILFDYGAILFVPIIATIILIVLGLYRILKKNKYLGWFLTSYILFNLLFILFLEPTFRNPRYFLPIIPVILIILYFPIEELINKTIPYAKAKR